MGVDCRSRDNNRPYALFACSGRKRLRAGKAASQRNRAGTPNRVSPIENAGPHGSIYPHILKFNYTTIDYTPVSYQAYELCFQCHDYNQVVLDESNEFAEKVHKKHILDENTPCNVCHDPHGISSAQGNAGNHSHLINFDLSVVRASTGAMGRLEFIDNGNYAGACYLNCHGKNHNPKGYN